MSVKISNVVYLNTKKEMDKNMLENESVIEISIELDEVKRAGKRRIEIPIELIEKSKREGKNIVINVK